MITAITYSFLQNYWWAIIALLGGLLVFLMFVQGGQTLIYSLAKTNDERTLLINVLGRKWEFTFTTLVTFGGAFFASFPLFYATSFGGAYWVWFAILFTFILQAVSYEFRSKPSNFLGKKTYEAFLLANGILGPLLIGTAVGTFFNGAEFTLNDYNQVIWATPYRGLEALLSVNNVALGLTVLFLSRILGLMYFSNAVKNLHIEAAIRKKLIINTVVFVVFFFLFIGGLFLKTGVFYNPDTLVVASRKNHYLLSLLEQPIVLILFMTGVVTVLLGIYYDLVRKPGKGIWYSGAGAVITVFSLFLLAGYNNGCFYPSIVDLQSSLNIRNSSSSEFTLKVMSIVSLMIPFVVAYIWYAWRSINNKKLDLDELDNESHKY